LKKFPHISVVGEMLDWDAPTGGFLLQGCFSTAFFAAQALLTTN
jgi:predicted flavoprotein YhiN